MLKMIPEKYTLFEMHQIRVGFLYGLLHIYNTKNKNEMLTVKKYLKLLR